MNSHIFTEASLGKSPFKVIDYLEKSTGCAYCGRAIKKVSVVMSADGNKFHVGCECVKKTGDKGLIEQEKVKIKKFKAQVKYEKQMEVYYQIMFDKWSDHPLIDQSKRSDKEQFLAEMERVMKEVVNNQ